MKRIIILILLIIIHAYSAFSLSTRTNHVQSLHAVDKNQHSNIPEKQQTYFYNSSTFISSGVESVVVNFGFNLLKLPQRINFGSENEDRIRNFKLLVQQKFNCTNLSTTLWLAYNQCVGYYLYHLRKLLI